MASFKPGKHIHFEGNEYEATGIVTHTQTNDVLVLYHALDDNEFWVCPIDMWSEEVEHDGCKVIRFRHIDDINAPAEPPPSSTITKLSDPTTKIKLFLSLFAGRTDVYAKRWESTRNGKSGYVPDCYNAWSPRCPKSNGEKMKCSECSAKRFIPFDENAVERHLTGSLTIGVYPILLDDTCRFLAFDFDAKVCSLNDIKRDVSVIREVCKEHRINMAVERSRSGKGIHFWIFFSECIPVSTARKFGSSLITHAMSKHHSLSFKTYDRLIPNQDSLPKGGFGNLIALPLQKYSRKQGNSVFIDDNFAPYADQWGYLSRIKKYSLSEVEHFIQQLSPVNPLGALLQSAEKEDEKLWEAKKLDSKRMLSKADFPERVKIVIANMLYIEDAGFKSPALNALKRLAAFPNPEFYKTQAMRMSTHNKPRIISCSDETEQYMCLPRGLSDEVKAIFNEHDVKIIETDETNKGRSINVHFKGKLRSEQQQASDALLAHNNGILSATTAFGKTVIGAFLVASRKVNTLILVHRTSLLHQWIERLNDFLDISDEPEPEFTPKGRKRKKSIIGQIGGGKNNLSGIIDVAIIQSLVSGNEVKELVKNYGMVIVDECHHVSAFSFEQVLKAVSAKYVYGLTATPTRKDGHHPIIYMHCGKIRYRVDAKKQADERPFEHYIIPRFTRFQKPAHQDENKWTISDIYNDIARSEIRNNQIVQDVVVAVAQGRNPIILTERTEHVSYLAEMLSSQIKNVITLTGNTSQKQNREKIQMIANIPLSEPLVLVATGRYVGEGFDMPRLDTLFLAMPISWKGTVQQYAGRLHRLFDGKSEVQIYDYVDVHVAMLERMYQKRLKGYASIGYKAKDTVSPIEEIHSIFDSNSFFPVYSSDIMTAKTEVVIVSPFLTMRRVVAAMQYLNVANARLTVITRPQDSYAEKDRGRIDACMNMLNNCGITVKTKDRIHQKFAVIDQRLVWYGSVNLLSYSNSEESIMRIESVDIAGELLIGIGL